MPPVRFCCGGDRQAGYKAGEQISLRLDVAQYRNSTAMAAIASVRTITAAEMVDQLESPGLSRYRSIVSIEDGLAETTGKGLGLLSQRLGQPRAAGGRPTCS